MMAIFRKGIFIEFRNFKKKRDLINYVSQMKWSLADMTAIIYKCQDPGEDCTFDNDTLIIKKNRYLPKYFLRDGVWI